jgi:hypothetical protein
VNGRRLFLILQLVAIIAFWVGLYELREKALAFSAAHRRAEERAKADEARRAIEGLWRSSQAMDVQLELRHGRFKLQRNDSVPQWGEYKWSGERLKLWSMTGIGISGYWSLLSRLEEEELVLWDDGTRYGQNGDWTLLLNMLGKSIASEVYSKEKVLRFVRVRQ